MVKQLVFLASLALALSTASAQNGQVKLKYGYADLEPYIDSTTVRIHYSAHHAAYAANLSKTLESYPDLTGMPLMMLLRNISTLPQPIQQAVRNNGGGVYNHNLYFESLTAPSNSVMPDELKAILEKQYGSVEAFKAAMEKAALSRFGSGWAWLLVYPNGTLAITTTANQDAPFMDVALTEVYPIFNIDVWEHAYYLKYRNKRADYLANLWKVVDWRQLYSSYLKAIGQ
ncbi:superoxide dismutase [uncultured Acetobacteroides sp.]|uniref:superoxide dismutase n=1 Tax=uncultured Acetobacteroides sp. TaxID=1760811 RepID=UPI0029F458A1|nr:superoxide dismutase [uncultured Acetobacteroides sp.]